MKARFFGGAGEVTGSKLLLEHEERRLLLDCGLFQGHRREAIAKNLARPFDAARLDAVLLSHAHIDHSGGLPLLSRRGLSAPIYCTPATADLCGIMLLDSARIQEEDAKFFNKIHLADGQSIEPLYGEADARAALSLFRPRDYGVWFEAAPGLRARFLDAGHVLGSAIVEVEWGTGAKVRRLVFSGDLGRRRSVLMRPPSAPERADYLVIESTYGGRRHEPLEQARERLGAVVRRVADEKGRLLVPSFALERTQDLLFLLAELRRAGRIPPVPVYLDSPMGASITGVFHRHRARLVPEAGALEDPFGLDDVRILATADESKSINERAGPMIVVAGAGMCEGGRILHHLRNWVGRDETTVLIVGYQAEGTLGRRLASGARKVKIFGLEHEVWARVEQIDGLSAHADAGDLDAFILPLSPRPRKVFLVHGQDESREAFAARLRAAGVNRVELPALGETFDLG